MPRHLALLSAFAVLFGPATAFADVVTPARESQSTISFSDPAFSDARLRINATQTIASGSSGARNEIFAVSPNLQSYALSSTGAVGVTLNSLTPPDVNYPFNDFDLTVAASGGGSWTITEDFAADSDPFGFGPLYRYSDRNDIFYDFVNNTLPTLEFYLPIGGLVDIGGRFGIGFTIAGDWSTTGGLASTTGQHYLANLDPAWSIDQSFVFDPVANVTRFHATNPSYEGVDSDHPSPGLDVFFFGAAAAVPEPGTWATLILGFGLVGGSIRRSRGANALGRARLT